MSTHPSKASFTSKYFLLMIRDLLANSVHSFADNSILLMVSMFPETLNCCCVFITAISHIHISISLHVSCCFSNSNGSKEHQYLYDSLWCWYSAILIISLNSLLKKPSFFVFFFCCKRIKLYSCWHSREITHHLLSWTEYIICLS